VMDRPSPAYDRRASTYFVNITRGGRNDSLLVGLFVAKQLGKSLLIQETGLQRELHSMSSRGSRGASKSVRAQVATSLNPVVRHNRMVVNSNSIMTEGN